MKSTKTVNDILYKNKVNTLSLIQNQQQKLAQAQKALDSFNIPYFKHVKVCFYNGHKLLLSTHIPELLSKFRELKHDFIKLLTSSVVFAELKTINIKMQFDTKSQPHNKSHKFSTEAKKSFIKLANSSNNVQIRQKIAKMINNHEH